MPVPNDVIFGPNPGSIQLSYGQVRQLDDDGKLRALKSRIDSFFVSQVDPLGKDDLGGVKVYSPFPLALLTCVGIEMLGQVMYHDTMGAGDSQREGFVRVAKSIHPGFSKQLGKKFKGEIASLFPGKDAKKIKSAADILYFYQRNTLIHGYQSRGVYLTEGSDQWELKAGALRINPYWFWQSFKVTYEGLFEDLFENQEHTNPLRMSAISYLSAILG